MLTSTKLFLEKENIESDIKEDKNKVSTLIPFLELNTHNDKEDEIREAQKKKNDEKTLKNMKYKSSIQLYTNTSGSEIHMSQIEKILDNESFNNKSENWCKIDKNQKIQLLHKYAEKYERENNLTTIENLKMFFTDCIEKQKLLKAKDVVYNKELKEIVSIPSLTFNTDKKQFTLKIMDLKRQSTLKSLTPKKIRELHI
jgi:hypothetical protein